MASQIEIFFCYAREDEELRRGLEKQLKALQLQGIIDIWHDRAISPGMEWEQEIDKHLNTAQIILLLISPDFMASDYAYGTEMKRAMERHECKDARVIPIILRPIYWRRAPFGKLQALPTNAQPITTWHNLDEAFFDVAEGIRIAVEELISKYSFSMLVTSITLDLELDEPSSTTAYISAPLQITEIKKTELPDELPDWDSLTYDDEPSDKPPFHDSLLTSKDAVDELPAWDSLIYNNDLSDTNTQHINSQNSPTPTQDPISYIENQYPKPNPTIKSVYDILLSVKDVKEKWEYITRRIRTRKGGAKIAALLTGCAVIDIENTIPKPTIAIRARASFHYDALQKKEDQEIIIWALKVELNIELYLRLLPPEIIDNDLAIRALLPSTISDNSVTIQTVKEKWEHIKRRVRTKKGGVKIAALLNGCAVIDVENISPLLTIIIKANSHFHYTGLQRKEDQKIIEWALTIELNQVCLVRILSP